MKMGWKTKTLGEICEIERGGSPRPIDSYITDDPDGINWIKIGDTKNVTKYIEATEQRIKHEGAKRSRIVYPGDFILSNSMSFGRPYIMKTTGCIHDGWLVLRQPTVDQNFLYHVLGSDLVFSQFDRLASGSTVRNLNIGLVTGVKIPVPPLPEQQRIVAILDEAFESIATAKANAEQNLKNARELFESHLQFVFTQRGEGWANRRLGDLIHLISGQHIEAKDYNTESRGVGYLTGPSDFGQVHPIVSKWTETPKVKAKKGDILITVKGSGVGKINFLDEDEVAISRQLMSIRVINADRQFIYAFLSAAFEFFQTESTGAAIPGISREQVLGLQLMVPPPVEQQRIVVKLELLREQTQRLESLYQRKVAALDELKKSLLHKAFSGEL